MKLWEMIRHGKQLSKNVIEIITYYYSRVGTSELLFWFQPTVHDHTENADYDWPPNLDDDSEDGDDNELGGNQSSLHRKSEELLVDPANATDVAIRVYTKLDILFCQIATFIKVLVAFVFGLQIL